MTNRHIARTLNTSKAGNIESALKSYAVMDDVSNDGEHYYSIKEVIPVTALPIGSEDEIEIRLTDSDFHVIRFEDSFLTFNLKVTIIPNRDLIDAALAKAAEETPEKEVLDHQYMFFGLKSGSQIIREYYIVHRGRTVDGTRQNNATHEAFLMNLYKPKSEKNNRKHIHSLYSEVHSNDTSACGAFVPITELKAGKPFSFTMPVSCPLDDICLLQGFSQYPVALFGELKLKFRINPAALVYCRVDPIASGVKHLLTRYTDTSIDPSGTQAVYNGKLRTFFDTVKDAVNVPGSLYTRHFTQIGCPSYQFQLGQKENKTIATLEGDLCNFIPTIQSVSVQRCTLSMSGYRASTDCLRRLTDYFSSQPFVIPAQRVEIKALASGPHDSGFQQCQTNIPLNHVSDFILLFPKDSKQITCFENPMYQDLQLAVANRNIPERPVTTCGDPQFFQMMLNASDLDSLWECTDEYEDSLTLPRSTETRIINPRTDITSFAVTLPVERPGVGLAFDGWDSRGENIAIELRGSPMFRAPYDTYSYPCIHPSLPRQKNTQAPILCTLQDSFWLFTSKDGGECHYTKDWTVEEAMSRLGFSGSN